MMKKHLLLSLLIGLLIPMIGAAGLKISRTQVPSATGTLQPAETQADFDLMRKALEEAHSGLYRYTTKAEMDRTFDAQRAKLSRPMTKAEFHAVATETLAKIRCGHTGIAPDEELRTAYANARLFPLRLLVEGRRLMVLFNDTPDDQTIRPGMEVVEINRRKAGDILDHILPNDSAYCCFDSVGR